MVEAVSGCWEVDDDTGFKEGEDIVDEDYARMLRMEECGVRKMCYRTRILLVKNAVANDDTMLSTLLWQVKI